MSSTYIQWQNHFEWRSTGKRWISLSLAIASDTLLAEKGNYYSLRQQNNFLLLYSNSISWQWKLILPRPNNLEQYNHKIKTRSFSKIFQWNNQSMKTFTLFCRMCKTYLSSEGFLSQNNIQKCAYHTSSGFCIWVSLAVWVLSTRIYIVVLNFVLHSCILLTYILIIFYHSVADLLWSKYIFDK